MRLVRRHPWRSGSALLAFALVAAACGSTDTGAAIDDEREESVTVAPNPNAKPISVSVTFTNEGFEPETIFIPAGHPVRLALRNRTEKERHYRVAGLVASSVRWVVYPEVNEYELDDLDSMSDEELRAIDPDLVGITDEAEMEHILHHLHATYSTTKPESLWGIKPVPGEVHGYAQRGGADTMTFYALKTGRYEVEDVLYPEFAGTVVVFLPSGADDG